MALLAVASVACRDDVGVSDTGGSDGADASSDTGATSGTTGGTSERTFPPPAFDLDGTPRYSRALPLTNSQWANSVRSILRLEARPTAADSFLAPASGFTLFLNNERVLEVTNELRESYQLAAADVARTLVEEPGAMARIGAGNDGETFVRTFGRRAFRRPLTEEEITRYVELYAVGEDLSGPQDAFTKGAGLVVEAMLQSPHFLYRTELSPSGLRLNGYELAAKLSFWLLDVTPSDELLDRAEALTDPSVLHETTAAMLEEPGSANVVVGMYAELLRFARYASVAKSSPVYTAEMNAELETVSELFFEKIYRDGQGLREILTSTSGFVGPELAVLYGMNPVPAEPTYRFLGPDRPGYFAQVPYLMLFGNDEQSDAIHRGLFLNYLVMCAKLPEPNFEIPPLNMAQPDWTNRELIEANTGFGTCGEGCHGGYINPLGYAFENFDGLGRLRAYDNGKPVDTVSAYPLSDEGMTPFSGAPELMTLLAESPAAHACFAKSIMSYALQRDIVPEDRAVLDQLTALSMSPAGSIKSLVLQLVQTPSFYSRPGV